jgi:hypothetical protein
MIFFIYIIFKSNNKYKDYNYIHSYITIKINLIIVPMNESPPKTEEEY